jgi:conjugative transfer region lipoprotein (TIGR03751 family)
MVKAKTLLIATAIILSGCSSSSEKDRMIPKSDETMRDIYINGGRTQISGSNVDQEFVESKQALLARGTIGTPQVMDVYRLNQVSTQANFNKLHNPTIYMYFPPKISETDRLPIPAMMTEFKMYDRDEYVFGDRFNGERK